MPFAKLTQGLSALGNNLDNQLSKSCEQMVGRESGSHSNHPTGISKSFDLIVFLRFNLIIINPVVTMIYYTYSNL